MLMSVCMLMSVFVVMSVVMRVLMPMPILMRVRVAVRAPGMNIEFDALNLTAFGAMGVQMVAVQGEFPQFLFNLAEFHSQIQHGPQEHVSADAAENIQIKCFQSF